MSFGLYLHIPYCGAKCRYCDFYSMGAHREVPDAYLDALLREIARHGASAPRTVYFGGGTPSLLSPDQVRRILSAVQPLPGAEITLEANPDTLTPEKLSGYRAAGVSRLSIGVQSARDEQLRRLGRLHTARQAASAFAMAREAGFDNISGDIMLALPGYTDQEFLDTLDLIEQGGADHISCYLLKLEPGTYLYRHPPADLPDEDQAAAFYLFAVKELEKRGYLQYEISNFARPGRESAHNLIYWDCEDYLGIGPAAYSCMGGRRFHYPPDLPAFLARPFPLPEDGRADAEDFIMLQLRLKKGLSLARLKEEWNYTFSPAALARIPLLEQAGYCTLQEGILQLTPAGMLVQNAVLTTLL